MVTNAKVTVGDVKKAAANASTTVKAAAATATEVSKKAATEVKKEAAVAKKTATKAKATATKKATAAKKTATKTVKKAAAKAKNDIPTTAVVQYQGLEFSEADCLKKAKAAFKKDYKGKTLEELNIYIKPEEHKIYYVANKDCVGSVEL
ncbi:MAG: DUF6465 family protein [Pseudobutyrivibrio sp.]|nr:DUF6465 family protein [Pseudobutyrivibrio sp.]